ncbi:class I SAM-dependent methyltransferase [Bdellovibrio sp. HCB290]|uniref:class I SAM-dependent methyltransferase n=1 Tax=Bdellovibrio sp. HCB290 TaxID=3394356 RepID=UPI0039B407FF
MESYYDAHERAYKEIKSKGYIGWGNAKTLNDVVDPITLNYLKSSIQQWTGKGFAGKSALDLGCGAGATAFTMAQLGLNVTGIDISATAIEMAKDLANQQNLKIDFMVGDVLRLENLNRKFDIIYDSHCLHCIVFDEDRQAVFNGIKNSLSKDGIFILDTAVVDGIWDPASTIDTLRFDENYILWHKTKPSDTRGVIEIEGQHWCAQRRFYPASKVMEEVERAGFKILSQVTEAPSKGGSSMLRLVLQS